MIRLFSYAVLFTLAVITATTCHAHPDPAMRPATGSGDRLLYIDGVITGSTVSPIRQALADMVLSPSKAPVVVVINSPGGSISAGMVLVNQLANLRSRGVEVDCYVLDMAASMAFQLLTSCSTRHALPASFLLWHGVRIGTSEPITGDLAEKLAMELHRMDQLLMYQLLSSLHLTEGQVRVDFEREHLWTGYELHAADPEFIRLETGYGKLMQRLSGAVRTKQELFLFDQLDTGLILIWDQWYISHKSDPMAD